MAKALFVSFLAITGTHTNDAEMVERYLYGHTIKMAGQEWTTTDSQNRPLYACIARTEGDTAEHCDRNAQNQCDRLSSGLIQAKPFDSPGEAMAHIQELTN